MKHCLYIHDHIFKQKNNDFYSEGKITDEVFERYELIENQIINVLCRKDDISHTSNISDKLSKITKDNVHFYPVKGRLFSHIFGRFFLKNIRMILKLISSSDFIVVRLPSFLGVFCLVLNIFYRKHYFVEFVGSPKDALLTAKPNHSFFYKKFVSIFTRLNQYFVLRADGVIYVTQYSLQKDFPTKGFESIASNVEVNVEPKEPIAENYIIHSTPIKVGIIASYNNEYKGLDIAIKAISILKNKQIDITLHVLGSGRLLNHYKNLSEKLNVKENIHFDGSLPGGSDVLGWLKSLNIYIQPSRTEGLPRALIEAMSVGLPCIASNVGGIPELLSDKHLIETEDSETLAEKIYEFILSENERFNSGVSNWKIAKMYDSRVLKDERQKFWLKAKAKVY